MTAWMYLQVFLQAFVAIGGAMVCLASLYVSYQEWGRHNRALGCLWAFLSLAGLGIALAAGPFLMDSIPTRNGVTYMAGGSSFHTFSIARYSWSAYAAGTLWHIWNYTNRARWFGITVPCLVLSFCWWVMWIVWRLHG